MNELCIKDCFGNKPELLAPAGGMEQLRAALLFGADAVYLAADKFGMRARAANFSMDEIFLAVQYAHDVGSKVYVTCNTLMHDSDIQMLPNYFDVLAQANVDAFIIGDIGAAAIARKIAPQIDLCVSTQASVANAAAANVWYELGARRVVCAREMSLDDIAEMRSQIPCDLQLEAFVHGAMCMAVSGRCLISSYLTGRSANKGNCTQPCRWKYTLEEEKRPGQYFDISEDSNGTYIMNAKDLNMLEHLEDLASAGINSFKIEGRNKKAFYVSTIVNAYRHVIDGEPAKDYVSELMSVSHRPYSTGFYFGQPAQSCDFDGYEQTCLHVADVIDCTKEKNGFQITVLCRNRFCENEELEILSPHVKAKTCLVKNLQYILIAGSNRSQVSLENVDIANRAKQTYTFLCDEPIMPGSYLRRREYHTTSRE